MRRMLAAGPLLALLLPAPARAEPPVGFEFFENKVRPVLVQHCFSCHSDKAKKLRGGLRVDSLAALLKGGDSGPALVPGNPEKSRLIHAITYADVDLQMPPRGKLPAQAIADLQLWVKRGAAWPAEKVAGKEGGPKTFDLTGRRKSHWAWRPVRRPPVPAVRDGSWGRGPVDAFLLAKLEENGLKPATDADRRTLLRRLSFDLIGLPPAPAEVEAFVNDTSPQYLEKVVDRLLASPAFGERWARHWLDLVRYAETRGHEFDFPIPNAWHYRDYVVRALNAGVPYDQWVREHVAGDLLPRPRLHPGAGFNESILGTGFWFLGEEIHSPVDIRADQADRFDNRIDVLTKTFLGLTVACARCHDHKFDAISQKDYYALYGFLSSSNYRLVRFDSREHNHAIARDLADLRARTGVAVGKALAEEMTPVAGKLADYLLGGAGADPALVKRWASQVQQARKDANHPLHPFARLSADPKAGEALKADWRRREEQAGRALKDAEILVDYARCSPADWLPDADSFGPGPVAAGTLRLEGNPARPSVRIVTQPAAEFDAFWAGQGLAPGVEKDPGSLGNALRPGRTLRTPSFTLKSGKIHYLVRGSGLLYASVGSHVMLAGPLHGRLVQNLPASKAFRWGTIDLSPYRGQHAHLEFTAGGNDFAVALIVQGDRPPVLVEPPPLADLVRQASTPEALARGFQERVQATLAQLSKGRVENATLAGWLLRHRELFGATDKGLAAVAGPLLAEQDRLAGKLQRSSRLAVAMQDGTGVNEPLFIRGSHKAPGAVVPRRFLEALAGTEPLEVARGSGRLELARQMTDPERNPFLARVMVNRIAHHLLGRGIVPTPDNFGVMGQSPTHPELLDWLADDFVGNGWSIKATIRRLVLSRAYGMRSERTPEGEKADPENLLFHRANLRRLEGEAIRDALLALSGRLDRRLGGRPVPVYLTEFQQGRGRPGSGPLDGNGRRSLYLAVRRNFLSSFLLAFDTPTPFSTVGKRTVSNVPAQSLILMNDPFVHHQAGLWATCALAEGGSVRERVERMYQAAFGRPATAAELSSCLEFLKDQPDERAAWADLAHALVNVKEFIFLR